MTMDSRPIDVYCMDCKFYYDADTPITCGSGECRYGPPTAIYEGRNTPYASGKFPFVSEYDWCWRFEKK